MNAKEFSLLFSALSDKLFRIAKSMLQDDEEAADMVQELQLKMWEKRDGLNRSENKSAFVIKSMRNMCIDSMRKQRPTENIYPELESSSPNPAKELEIRDMSLYISKLIDRLPETQRDIIRMRDVEGMEIFEISYIMELSENAVTVNLSRARSKIRTLLLFENQ